MQDCDSFLRLLRLTADEQGNATITPNVGLRSNEESEMAARANWKGFLKVAELSCPVALYTAVSTSDRIAFHTLNRETGHRVHRQFVDSDTGKSVERDDQVKGYDVGSGDYVVLEPEDIAAAIPESDKTLEVQAFVACDDIDDVYIDRPYYLAPSNPMAVEAFTIIREGMRAKKTAALAQTVLFRRARPPGHLGHSPRTEKRTPLAWRPAGRKELTGVSRPIVHIGERGVSLGNSKAL
jgi:hypothetical protein